MRNSLAWLSAAALVLAACGPAGVISGRVTVEGGSPGGHAVIIYGPISGATVTGDDGTFSLGSLPDGKYVVTARVPTADVPEQSIATTVTNGAAAPEPVLNFRASTARVTGRVVMADGSGAENLSVIAEGPETKGARTAADGSFTFENLKTGAYVVSVEAKDTKEGRVAVGVNASGTAEVIELRLTPVGRVGGIVSFNALPAQGVAVTVPGTGLAAVTDDKGAFRLEGVPTGAQTVLARIGSEPFWRSATAMVTIVRGANPDLAMTLSDDPPKTGTVTGVVTFGGARSARDITVSARGTSAMTNPTVSGAFSLSVPIGTWDIVASAPQHPPKVLGRVTVTEGSAQTLVGQELSWFRPIWQANQAIAAPVPLPLGITTTLADAVPWTLLYIDEAGDVRIALVNMTTGEFRILVYVDTLPVLPKLSRTARYAAWQLGTTVFVYETATGNISTNFAPQGVASFEFSTDESVLFIHRSNNTLTRMRLGATPTTEVFPPTGTAGAVFMSTPDRWFVRETNSIRLVTPMRDVQNIFTNVSSFSLTPTAWALTNCTTTCELRLLAPNSESPAVRDAAISVSIAPGTSFNAFTGSNESRGDVPCFQYNNGTTLVAFCARASDGTHFPLPAVPTNFRINEPGTRVIWTAAPPGSVALREEAFPPGPSTAPLATNTVGYSNVGWLSDTRAFAVEAAGAPSRVIHLVRSGTATTETDIGAQSVNAAPPLLVFPRATTSRWQAILGDGMTRTIDLATSNAVLSVGVRPLGTGPITRYAAVGFDNATAYVIDEAMGAVRLTPAGRPLGLGQRSGTTEFITLSRSGSNDAIFVFNTGAILESGEHGTPIPAGTPGLAGYFARGDDGRTIMLGTFQ